MTLTRRLRALRRDPRVLSSLGLSAVSAFIVALLALHAAFIGHEPDFISQFANSRFGPLWVLAVCAFIAGGALLAWALRSHLPAGPSTTAGLRLLGLAGVGSAVLAVFPTDAYLPATLPGTIHNEAALTTFVLLGAAMVVLTPAFRSSPALGRFARVSLVLGLLVNASWATVLVTTLRHAALRAPAQRVLVALIAAWFVLLALDLRRAPRPVWVAQRRRKLRLALPLPARASLPAQAEAAQR